MTFLLLIRERGGNCNSLVGSGGGLAFFQKPASWSVLRADRYTLEVIEKEQTYTLSYFPYEYKEKVFFLAGSSGRDSDKMMKVSLTKIKTPEGNISYEEARLIIECKLLVLTTVGPDDLYAHEAKDFVFEEYREESHYRKIAFGEITNAWVKK
jgi:flavin reductase (DIM6/NTAB) family NADH-FMN oxidoreductase RutF